MTTDLTHRDAQTVDLIEHALATRPTCDCGRHTVGAWHDGHLWVECSLLGTPVEGRVRRVLRALDTPLHTRVDLGDLATAA